LAKCQFPTVTYWDYERLMEVPYNCDSKDKDVLASGLCSFHDKNYLQDKMTKKNMNKKLEMD
jgi:hypothetical protein